MEGLDSLTDIGGKMGFLLNTIKESGGINMFFIFWWNEPCSRFAQAG